MEFTLKEHNYIVCPKCKNEDGIVGEGIYDRRNRTWTKPDGSRLDRITHWSLIPDSPITKK